MQYYSTILVIIYLFLYFLRGFFPWFLIYLKKKIKFHSSSFEEFSADGTVEIFGRDSPQKCDWKKNQSNNPRMSLMLSFAGHRHKQNELIQHIIEKSSNKQRNVWPVPLDSHFNSKNKTTNKHNFFEFDLFK